MPDFKQRARRSAYFYRMLCSVLRESDSNYDTMPPIESFALEGIMQFCAHIIAETPDNRQRLWVALRAYTPGMINIILPDPPESSRGVDRKSAPVARPDISALDFLDKEPPAFVPERMDFVANPDDSEEGPVNA